jgi:hypothetical protein
MNNKEKYNFYLVRKNKTFCSMYDNCNTCGFVVKCCVCKYVNGIRTLHYDKMCSIECNKKVCNPFEINFSCFELDCDENGRMYY